MYDSFLLDLLAFAKTLQRRQGEYGDQLWCQVRRKWLATQPEELVRQALISYLRQANYPLGLMQVEKKVAGSKDRLDLLVLDPQGHAFLLAEAKAPELSVAAGMAQLAHYARSLRAPYCLSFNGREAICMGLDYQNEKLKSLDSIPAYPPR